MNYRLAQKTDIDRLVSMAESAKAYFRENGIDQWQKGEPNAACMLGHAAPSSESGRPRLMNAR